MGERNIGNRDVEDSAKRLPSVLDVEVVQLLWWSHSLDIVLVAGKVL